MASAEAFSTRTAGFDRSVMMPRNLPNTVAFPIPAGPEMTQHLSDSLRFQALTYSSKCCLSLLISMSLPRMPELSLTGASFFVILLSLSTGRYTGTLASFPLTLIEQIFSNTALPLDAFCVSVLTNMQQFAFCISLAARITLLPTAVYSKRTSFPTSPQIVVPVAIPRQLCTVSRSFRFFLISMAACTALTGSSSCAIMGKPNTIFRTVPLSSI
mmetsp:Transcript_40842/g.95411  ORF Transcript_40842/g.95411 Transcript_40842/m.95411 type:complete len:214 (+) Transcript_40842:2220-2861(+)